MSSNRLTAQHDPRAERSWAQARAEASLLPAASVLPDGTPSAHNKGFAELLHDGQLLTPLRTALVEARLSNRVHAIRFNTSSKPGDDNNKRFEVTFIPVDQHETLVIAKDQTLEANLVNALAASRQLFRDLALCSNDFAFETDAFAHFTYTSPGGFLGFTAQELHGSRPRSFFAPAGVAQLFSVKEPIHAQEMWTTGKDGSEACIVVTAVPMKDSEGAWCGARGVVRDLTKLRQHEAQVAHSRAREDLVFAVVNAMRAQVEPRRMMLAAVDAISAATQSHYTAIQTEQPELNVSIGTRTSSPHHLKIETTYHGKTNGNIILMRDENASAYDATAVKMMSAITPHLGIAIALAKLVQPAKQAD